MADVDRRAAGEPADAWQQVRTVLVPPDIVGVHPRSPVRVRRSTPLRRQTDAATTTDRSGDRTWFSDHLFCESQEGHAGTGFGTSITVHTIGVVALAVFLITRPDRVIAVRPPSLPMPAIVAPPPVMPDMTPQVGEQPKPRKTLEPPAPPPPPPKVQQADTNAPAAAPVEAPAGVTPETGAEKSVGGVEGGVPGGVPGGVVGGVVGGAPPSGSGTAAPIRVGSKMQPPRKIKDVKPVYPDGALPSRSQGAVVIEAIIGPDGKVQDAKVIHSVPTLDKAALDAVRQWEYAPSMLNGVAVAVVMTVVVNFAMQ